MAMDVLGTMAEISELDSDQHDDNGDDAAPSTVAPSSSASQWLPAKYMKQKRARQHRAKDLWSYSRRARPDEEVRDRFGHKFWYCDQLAGSCDFSGTTTLRNARKHLCNQHGINSQEAKLMRRPQNIQQSMETCVTKQQIQQLETRDQMKVQLLRETVDAKSFDTALVRLITRRSLPHRLVEWPEFKAFCLTLNPESAKLVVGSHTTVPRRIRRSYHRHQQKLKALLKHARSKIHLCTDTWTSPPGHKKEYQAINAHFIDSAGRKRKALLALPELVNGHGGEYCAQHIMETLEIYSITDVLGGVCSDNASAMDKTCNELAKLLEAAGVRWDPIKYRLRCLGHVLNLPVQAFLFTKDKEAINLAITEAASATEPLDEVLARLCDQSRDGWHRVVPIIKLKQFAHSMRSNRHYQRFKRLAGKMIHLPNETRWNTWTTMIEDAFMLRPFINQYIAEHRELHHMDISLLEWQLLDDTYQFLLPIKEATKACEGDHVTLDDVLISMDIVVAHFKRMRAKHANNPDLLGSITTAWYAFDKYYDLTDTTPLYAAALLLHPAYRKAYLDEHWRRSWIGPAVENARKLWRDEYARGEVESGFAKVVAEPSAANEEPSFFEQQRRLLKRPKPTTEDEFERFINGQQLQPADGDAISWWLEPTQGRTYPRLRRMAIDVLSAPSMSAESERIWSMAKKTISVDRRNLGSEALEQSECNKSWIHHGIADEGDTEGEESDGDVVVLDTGLATPSSSILQACHVSLRSPQLPTSFTNQ